MKIISLERAWDRLRALLRPGPWRLHAGGGNDLSRNVVDALFQSSEHAIIWRTVQGRILRWSSAAEKLLGYAADETTGKGISLLVPHDRAAEQLAIDAMIRRGERVGPLTTARVHQSGRRVEVSVSMQPVRDAHGAVTGVIEIFREATDGIASASRMRRVLSAARCFDWEADLTVHDAGATAESPGRQTVSWFFRVPDEPIARQVLDLSGQSGEPVMQALLRTSRAADIRRGEQLAYDAVISGRSRYTYELRRRDRHGQIHWFRQDVTLAWHGEGDLRARGVCIDVTDEKHAVARLRWCRKRLRQMAHELSCGDDRERRRLALQLHDGLGQLLSAAIIKIDCMPGAADSSQKQLAEVRAIVDEALSRSRSLTFELSPPILYDLGLVPALEWLSGEMRKRFGLVVRLEGGRSPVEINEPLRLFAFQAARELLFNAVKHGRAGSASVTVEEDQHHLRLRVEDDGTGFDTSRLSAGAAGSSGFGLFHLRQRLEFLKGRVSIHSRPGAGARIELHVPLQIEPNREQQRGKRRGKHRSIVN